jgi:hypothetical protein
MIRSARLALALLLIPASPAPADEPLQPLLWPTDAGRCVTSGFCEFRPDHFHSGIDISTGGKVGFRCFAAGDGDIVRARVSCGGYGRAVYLRLADGRTVLYAHLSRFAGAVEDTVRALQERSGTSYVEAEFPAAAFPVRRGEVVGWTGQSGAGVPHLHMEIRDRLERPMDPLREAWPVPDTSAPAVTRVALTPLTPPSSVDGGSETVMLDVHPAAEAGGPGRLPRVIPVEGEIGIAVEIDETTDACRFRLAPRRIDLQENGLLLYRVEYERFAFSQTGLMDLQIDPGFAYRKQGEFHRLWRRAGNSLPFVTESAPGAGVLSAGSFPPAERDRPAEGPWTYPLHSSVQIEGERIRRLEIVVTDAAGNRGSVRVDLSFAAPPEIAALSAGLERAARAPLEADVSLEETWSDTVRVAGRVRAPGRTLRSVDLEYSLDAGETWAALPPAAPGPQLALESRFAVEPRTPGEARGAVLVRARAVDVLGASGLARTVAVAGSPAPPERPAQPTIVTRGPWFEVRFPESAGWSAMSGGVHEDQAVLVRPWGRGARVVLQPGEWSGPVIDWTGDGRAWKAYDPWGRPVPVRFRSPRRGGDGLVAEDDRRLARIRFPVGALPEEAFVLIREETAPADQPQLRPVAPIFVPDLGEVPLAARYDVTLRPAPGMELDPERVGIFVRGADGLRYIDSVREEGGWTAAARTLLGIGLFEDVTPPSLGEPRFEERHGRAGITFRAEDRGAGIACDGVEVRLDGAPVLHELDDETGDVIAYPPAAAAGAAGGRVEIRAVDRCGNESRWAGRVSFR